MAVPRMIVGVLSSIVFLCPLRGGVICHGCEALSTFSVASSFAKPCQDPYKKATFTLTAFEKGEKSSAGGAKLAVDMLDVIVHSGHITSLFGRNGMHDKMRPAI